MPEQTELPTVLVTNQVPDEVTTPLNGIARLVMGPPVGRLMERASVLEQGASLNAIINQAELLVDSELLDACPNLRIVANISIGINNLDLDQLRARGIVATNTPGNFNLAVAEHVIGGILTITRRLLECDHYIRSGKWDGFHPGVWDGEGVNGKTLGILGYGSIGRHLHKLAVGLGMKVLHHNLSGKGEAGWVELDHLLGSSDVLSVHVPLTTATRGMINRDFIHRMRPGSILVNTARGGIMRERDVVQALMAGHLRGAVLDVFEHEPSVSPEFISMRNVLLTPHVAGGTIESRRNSRLLAFKNVAAVLSGQPALTPVT